MLQKEPNTQSRIIFERIFNLSHIELQSIYSHINRTNSFENLMDYVACIYKLKYQVIYVLRKSINKIMLS